MKKKAPLEVRIRSLYSSGRAFFEAGQDLYFRKLDGRITQIKSSRDYPKLNPYEKLHPMSVKEVKLSSLQEADAYVRAIREFDEVIIIALQLGNPETKSSLKAALSHEYEERRKEFLGNHAEILRANPYFSDFEAFLKMEPTELYVRHGDTWLKSHTSS